MTVQELIKELEKFPKDMEVVDYDGDSFDALHYKRVYDQTYPYHEIEHLAVCIDFENNYIPLNIGELKDILKCQIYDYPEMYTGDDKNIVEAIISSPKEKDNDKLDESELRWEYYCLNERNKPVFKFKEFKS